MIFDVLFGIVTPLLCFIFDPIVFRGNFIGGTPLLGRLQLMAYSVAFIEISMLAIWLFGLGRSGARSLAVGGFLYAGALISLLVGITILPLSLLGTLYAGIGVLGFTPFLTFLVFWRNARRAFNLSPEPVSDRRKLAAVALGFVFVVGVPLAIQLKISSDAEEAVVKITKGEAGEVEAAAEQLRRISYLTYADTDKIVWAYHEEQDPARRERLARVYEKITGINIETRRTYLMD
jgi:hypothetical protein